MIIAAFILGIVIIGLIILINHLSHISEGEFNSGFRFAIMFVICLVVEIGMIIDITNEPHPTPMDVYQGKTTLEYTVRDGVKVDSIVVWKKKVKRQEKKKS